MKIAIVVNGTRGDVQPMLALAKGLITNGHEIICCVPPENEEFVQQQNISFIPFGPNYKELFRQNARMKGGAIKAPSPGEMKKETEKQIDLLPGLVKGSDLILGVGFVLGVHTAADILKIPYRFVIYYPVLLGTSKTDPFISRTLFGFGRSMTNMVMKGFINKKRTSVGLLPIKDVWANWMGDHVIVACDKELNAAREGVSFNFTQTGFLLLSSPSDLPEHVEKFIRSGKPPVFIGFGSNPVSRPEKYSRMFDEVSRAINQRLIVSKGWADLQEKNSQDVLYINEVPFDRLFPHLSAVVHHGGTGTMAIAARAGIPQIAFPFMADQFENRKRIVKLGLGPNACDFKKLSSSALISSINRCVADDTYRKNAIDISQKLQNSNGVELTVKLIENELRK